MQWPCPDRLPVLCGAGTRHPMNVEIPTHRRCDSTVSAPEPLRMPGRTGEPEPTRTGPTAHRGRGVRHCRERVRTPAVGRRRKPPCRRPAAASRPVGGPDSRFSPAVRPSGNGSRAAAVRKQKPRGGYAETETVRPPPGNTSPEAATRKQKPRSRHPETERCGGNAETERRGGYAETEAVRRSATSAADGIAAVSSRSRCAAAVNAGSVSSRPTAAVTASGVCSPIGSASPAPAAWRR